jgi:hypothetical protein
VPEIVLPVLLDDTRRGEEAILASPLGGSRFVIDASPGMVEGIAAGDEIEIAPGEQLGYRVLKRGGNLCVWFYFPRPVDETHPDVFELSTSVEALGGWLDGGYARMVVFTIPVSVGFAAVEAVLDAAVARHPESTWLYGNVYDPADGKTPLGWWS